MTKETRRKHLLAEIAKWEELREKARREKDTPTSLIAYDQASNLRTSLFKLTGEYR